MLFDFGSPLSFLLLLYIHSIVSSSDLARIAFLTPYFLVDSKKKKSCVLTGLGFWTFGHYLDLILRWVNMPGRPDSRLWWETCLQG